MFGSRNLVSFALLFCGAVWLSLFTLTRLVGGWFCTSSGASLKLGLLLIVCLGAAVGAAVALVRAFRQRVREIDLGREMGRDRDAPPWAQQ